MHGIADQPLALLEEMDDGFALADAVYRLIEAAHGGVSVERFPTPTMVETESSAAVVRPSIPVMASETSQTWVRMPCSFLSKPRLPDFYAN
jgi:hypothetical protein